MRLAGDYWWPDGDEANGNLFVPPGPDATRMWIEHEEEGASYYAALSRPRLSVAICAGGYIGIMPRIYSQHFARVWTFEPDELNWACLEKNTAQLKNVRCVPAGLGSQSDFGQVVHDVPNSGASYMVCGHGDGKAVPIMALDYLMPSGCDLLQLDVEGMEIFALEGAEKTIHEFQPLIVVEIKPEQCKRYGYLPAELDAWLGERGYREDRAAQRRNDHIYRPLCAQ